MTYDANRHAKNHLVELCWDARPSGSPRLFQLVCELDGFLRPLALLPLLLILCPFWGREWRCEAGVWWGDVFAQESPVAPQDPSARLFDSLVTMSPLAEDDAGPVPKFRIWVLDSNWRTDVEWF